MLAILFKHYQPIFFLLFPHGMKQGRFLPSVLMIRYLKTLNGF
jgi:hypothetical protein